MTNATPDGWQGILDPDERILWQGRPYGGFRLSAVHIALALFGMVFAGFAALWMGIAAQAGGVFWLFGLLHFTVGLGIALIGPFGDTFLRRRTWYTLTNRRAFVATDLPFSGRRLRDYPITPDTKITLREGALSAIYFASHSGVIRTTPPRHRARRTYVTPIGFDGLVDGRRVLAIFHQAQRDQAPPDSGPHP